MIRFDYTGRHVLVTGGTSGIGAAIASAYRDAGADVTLTGTRSSLDSYDDAPTGCRFIHLQLDDPDGPDRIAAHFEHLDILVNNAGGTASPEVFERTLDINLTAVFRLSTALRPLLKQSGIVGGGSVVNVASMMSYYGSAYFPGYSAAKGGLLLLTKSLAGAWAAENVRVNAVAPGAIRTRMTRVWANHDDFGPQVARNVSLGRWGEPEDLVGPVLFLTSPAASYIVGETITVSGGYKLLD